MKFNALSTKTIMIEGFFKFQIKLFLTILFSTILFLNSSIANFEKLSCEDRLKKALSKSDDIKKLKALEKAKKKCSEFIPLYKELAILYRKIGVGTNEDWQKNVFISYFKIIELNPQEEETRWKIGILLEDLGYYGNALRQYNWIIENSSSENMKNKAKAHYSVCIFMLRIRKDVVMEQLNIVFQIEDTDFQYVKSKKEFKGFGFLKDIIVTTAVVTGLTSTDGDGKKIQVALGLLSDWMNNPNTDEIEKRNDLLLGMITTIGKIIIDKKLDSKEGNIDFKEVSSNLISLTQNGQVSKEEEKFLKIEPEKDRVFKFDGFNVVEEWDVEDLSGNWTINQYNVFMDGRKSKIQNTMDCVITQNGKNIKMVYGKYSIVLNGIVNNKNILINSTFRQNNTGITHIINGELKIISSKTLEGSFDAVLKYDSGVGSPNNMTYDFKIYR